jgi:hypothetical protein
MKSLNSNPDLKAHPNVIKAAALTTTFRKPNFPTICGSKKQNATFVNKNTSIKVSGLRWKIESQVPGVAATEKHTQSEINAKHAK